jgi:hypothetical protein
VIWSKKNGVCLILLSILRTWSNVEEFAVAFVIQRCLERIDIPTRRVQPWSRFAGRLILLRDD